MSKVGRGYLKGAGGMLSTLTQQSAHKYYTGKKGEEKNSSINIRFHLLAFGRDENTP